MHVVSVNVGSREVMKVGARAVETGIRKEAAGRIRVGRLGVDRDVVADEEAHGGLDQAVYLYSAEDYAWWERELGRELAPGLFGENVTLSGFYGDVRIGDRFQVGEVLLEATAPRIPCSVFAKRMEEPRWVKRFAAARRTGFYARVLAEGEIADGDAAQRLPSDGEHPSVLDLLDLWYAKRKDEATMRRLLAAPLAERARAACDDWLAEATRR